MFEDFKESFVNFITSRIFVLMLVFLTFFGILLGRVFLLQIIHGEDYAESFTMKIKKEINIASTRGKIYDRNGEILQTMYFPTRLPSRTTGPIRANGRNMPR